MIKTKSVSITPLVEEPRKVRSVTIQLADNGYVVRISDSSYKEVELVFTSQAGMMRTVKEATSMVVDADEED
jgi:hypothetical protein